MNLSRFSPDAQRALALAHQSALDCGASNVGQEHLTLALLRERSTGLAEGLREAGAAIDAIVEAFAARLRAQNGQNPPVRDLSDAMGSFLQGVWETVRSQQRHQVRTLDLIEAILAEAPEQPARKRLIEVGAKPQDLQRAVALLKSKSQAPALAAPKARNLRKFSRCLTDLAREGLLDPVVGRDHEVRRLMQVLSRRVKNNPVLIGRPGVGKSSIVEGLAHRIASGDVPAQLKDTAIFAIDIGTLLAGSEYRGVFEERIKGALDDIREARGNIIMFIDEFQTVVRGGGTDLSAMLKPALASGELRCIGVTTLDDYRNFIEKDGALEQRLQPILVEEPSVDETISVLRGLKGRYEAHHDIRINDAALVAAAAMARRFIQGRSLPDKAIDLVDEAASKVRIELESAPAEVDAADRRASRLEAEARDLRAQRASDGVVKHLEEEAAALRDSVARDTEQWRAQKSVADRIRDARARLAWRGLVLEHAPSMGWSSQALRRAARHTEEIERRIAGDEARLAAMHRQRRLCRVDLDQEDVVHVVASWTGIPLSKLMEDERAKLLHMEQALHQRVVGQDQAVRAVSNAVRLARAGMKDPNRPVGSFLFLGPTGVGKTELSRALAEFLFDDEAAMVRIDMSEYMEKHTVSRLIGAPPGYIGYEDSGQLTEAVRRRPYSVVLFDEIEKAHPDVFNLLLQIMEDGRLTDGHGRAVDFKNTMLIMTSNVGGRLYRENLGESAERLDELLAEEMRGYFKPEFLNRVDAIVRFDMLQIEQIKDIVGIQARLVNRRLAGGGIRLEMTDGVKAYLAEKGFDILQGARPLKRLIQREVLEPLALGVLQGKYRDGDVVELRLGRGKKPQIVFSGKGTAAGPRRALRPSLTPLLPHNGAGGSAAVPAGDSSPVPPPSGPLAGS